MHESVARSHRLKAEIIFANCRPFVAFFLQVATFILQKILLDETGLSYICQTYERFSHVAMILVSIPVYVTKH